MKDANQMIIKDNENIKIKKKLYKEALASNDVYSACLYFSDLKNYSDAEIFLSQANLYSRFNILMGLQVKYLLKVLTMEDFSNYQPSFVFNSLIKYFMGVRGVDVAHHYADILGKIFKDKVDIKLIKAPKSVLAQTRFHVVDGELNIGGPSVTKFAGETKKVQDSQADGEPLDGGTLKEKASKESNMMKQVFYCYDLVDKGELDIAQTEAERLNKKFNNDPELIAVFYKIGSRSEKYRDKNFDYILNYPNKTNNSLVDMIKVEVMLRRDLARECLDYISNLSQNNYENYITFFSFSKACCLIVLNETDKAIEELKFLIAINPKDLNSRQMLKKLISWRTEGNPIDEKGIFKTDFREIYEELIDLISLSDEEFARVNPVEVESCLTYLTYVSSIDVIRTIIDKIIRTKTNINFLLDVLIDPEINDEFKLSVIRILLENGYEGKIFYLLDNRLKNFVPVYPKSLYAEINFSQEFLSDKDEMVFCLVREYALACLRVVKRGKDLSKFAKFVEDMIVNLMSLQGEAKELAKKEGVVAALFLHKFSEKEHFSFASFVPRKIAEDVEKLKNIYQDYFG